MKQEKKLEEAKRLYQTANADQRYVLERLFPELKESEDESIKIKKDVIKLVKFYYGSSLACKHTVSKDEMVAWLEKQGETSPVLSNSLNTGKDKKYDKPTDKVEPKFHPGQWCIDNEDGVIFQIVKVLDNTYTYKTNEGKEYSCTHYSLENDAKLWTIADAKDGDVLANCNIICIYKKRESEHLIKVHINYSVAEGVEETNDTIGDFNLYPATKEERDLLFSKMKEAGYMWDAEKKKIRKLETSPVLSNSLNIGKMENKGNEVKISPKWSKEDEEEFKIAIETLHEAGQHSSAMWLKSIKQRIVQ